jgi:fatty acid-binding protein DegV
MEKNIIVDTCVDFGRDTENIPRVPFRILIDDEEIIDENKGCNIGTRPIS